MILQVVTPARQQIVLSASRSFERHPDRMHAAAFHILQTAQRPISRRACRTIAGSRQSVSLRNFHPSTVSYQRPQNPIPTESDRYEENAENGETGSNGSEAEDGLGDRPDGARGENARSLGTSDALDTDSASIGIESAVSLQSEEQIQSPRTEEGLLGDSNQAGDAENLSISQRRQPKYGSGGRMRPNRPRAPEGLPPVAIPEWFLKRNVICAGNDVLERTLSVDQGKSIFDKRVENFTHPEDNTESDLTSTLKTKYNLNINVYEEIVSATRSGLLLRPPRNIPLTSVPRPFLHLQCPKEDGTLYLDSVVEAVTQKLSADLIRLDADDLAQIVGSYVDENLAWSWSKIAILGFEVQKVAGRLEDYEKDMRAVDDTAELDTEDDSPISRAMLPFLNKINRPRKTTTSAISAFSFPLSSFLSTARPRAIASPSSENMPKFEMFATQGDLNSQQPLKSPSEQWFDLKVFAALDALIGAADAKRAMSSIDTTDGAAQDAPSRPRGVIVQLKDFKLLNAIPDGRALLKKLRDVINKRWFDGRPVLMLGTTSTEELEPTCSKAEIQVLQSDVIDGETRTILVPPNRTQEQDVVFVTDEKVRIRDINIRHTEDMIMKLGGGNLHPSLSINLENGIDTATTFLSDLEDQVWSYPRVHRLATTIIGLNPSISNIDGTTLTQAYRLLKASDDVKFAWGAAELKDEDEVEAVLQDSKNPAKVFKDKIKKIRHDATAHEKKLLGGVVSPWDIRTTFSDVHAPQETVEALKTLTSLSLTRPEAFSYGVLATDKIPGLLLYGPPGTGKTLLAKAVAKESGATVLEVSGAEVTDMYVGEGEKNVKAIFSLAKKLSPCVVFIDEADSLLGSRSSESSKRTTHREIINQFLREWDGLKDLGAFIMVATNRPFDLDDAVLRRLPRRLLVDLPVEKDREAILRIHLKDEVLDESVSLASLARETPFYSGSDLKNVAVSAAMACIREENDLASKYTGGELYQYPPKRLLMKHHFVKGLDEISASISEDMGTLSAIRKFDERYGDRRGRRKKASSLGFGGTTVPERDSEAARVRKIKA